jgi:hypothetical protein
MISPFTLLHLGRHLAGEEATAGSTADCISSFAAIPVIKRCDDIERLFDERLSHLVQYLERLTSLAGRSRDSSGARFGARAS